MLIIFSTSISHAQELYRRSLHIGNTPEIQEKAQAQAHPYSMTALLSNFEIAEAGNPPTACGLHIAKYFRKKLVEEFSVIPLSSCEESQIFVDCSSDFLELKDDRTVFIKLLYNYRPTVEMKLELLVLSRSDTGAVGEIKVPREIKFKLAKIWDELTEIVHAE